jgi:hypothetical protein
MSVVHYRTCDHCGKKLDDMKDFPEFDINLTERIISVDLCSDCYDELERIMLDFVNRRAET